MAMTTSAEVLLRYLDARVQTQVSKFPTPLKGTLCIGVRRGGKTRWWVAEFGPQTKTRFVQELPSEFDAGIAMDGQTALWVLGAVKEPGSMHMKTGDPKLLKAFGELYIESSSLMSRRLRGAL
ncbi:MAG: hypothetical protein R3C68_16425 [Myxococcota bacterium]